MGTGYNLTRCADAYLTNCLYDLLQSSLNKQYLDIGCGTGNYTVALHQRGVNLTGVEPSEKMLNEARTKNKTIEWLLGKAEQIPLIEEAIDGAVASFTVHHWGDLEAGFKELGRVLKPGSRVVILTSDPTQMKGYWLNHFFPKMMADSIIQMPAFDLVLTSLKSAGFDLVQTDKYFVKPDLQDLFLYAGKHRPELYLNKQVRAGISSFASLAHANEVAMGLAQLGEAVENKTIEGIIRSYENDKGDYLFVTAKKIGL